MIDLLIIWFLILICMGLGAIKQYAHFIDALGNDPRYLSFHSGPTISNAVILIILTMIPIAIPGIIWFLSISVGKLILSITIPFPIVFPY